jgi:hypothetical protein
LITEGKLIVIRIIIRPSCFATTGNLCDTFSSSVTLEKKSEFIGQILAGITTSRPTKSVPHFLSYDVNGREHRVRVERLIFWGVTPQAEGNAESPGSGGASPYLRRLPRQPTL